jgi:hypothetical protein
MKPSREMAERILRALWALSIDSAEKGDPFATDELTPLVEKAAGQIGLAILAAEASEL